MPATSTFMTPTRSQIIAWRAVGIAFLYIAITQAAALIESFALSSGPLFNTTFAMLAGLAREVPGASLWPHLLDMNARVAGAMPLPLLGLIVTCCVAAGCEGVSRNLAAQRRKDLAIEREELLRLKVRHGRALG